MAGCRLQPAIFLSGAQTHRSAKGEAVRHGSVCSQQAAHTSMTLKISGDSEPETSIAAINPFLAVRVME